MLPIDSPVCHLKRPPIRTPDFSIFLSSLLVYSPLVVLVHAKMPTTPTTAAVLAYEDNSTSSAIFIYYTSTTRDTI